MNLTALFSPATLARGFNYEVLSFCLAAVATFCILLVYGANIDLPGFVFFN